MWTAGHNEKAFNESPTQLRVDATLELLAEMEVLADADVFVGSFLSNTVRILSVLRAGRGWGRETSLSVELWWGPFSRKRRLRQGPAGSERSR
jgi:hypothetical protein